MIALVDGADDAVGEAYASLLARQGFNLVLVARDAARVAVLANELRHRQGVEVTERCVRWDDAADVEALGRELLELHGLECVVLGRDSFVLPRVLQQHGRVMLTPSPRRRFLRHLAHHAARVRLVEVVPLDVLWIASRRSVTRLMKALQECTTGRDVPALHVQHLCVGDGPVPDIVEESWRALQDGGGVQFSRPWLGVLYELASLLTLPALRNVRGGRRGSSSLLHL